MSLRPGEILIYHITDLENLPGILAEGGLLSDAAVAGRSPTVIGYAHIKKRRLEDLTVPCCDDRHVGEFVPFYLCPRSPMLFTINVGATGRLKGSQTTIVHLVSTVSAGIDLGRPWAVSDGNAGAFHTSFDNSLQAFENLDWQAIHATNWVGRTHQKSAEFLVADFFPFSAFHEIGCYDESTAAEVRSMLRGHRQQTKVIVRRPWYY